MQPKADERTDMKPQAPKRIVIERVNARKRVYHFSPKSSILGVDLKKQFIVLFNMASIPVLEGSSFTGRHSFESFTENQIAVTRPYTVLWQEIEIHIIDTLIKILRWDDSDVEFMVHDPDRLGKNYISGQSTSSEFKTRSPEQRGEEMKHHEIVIKSKVVR